MRLGLGLGLTHTRPPQEEGGGGAYTAPAVHFDGATSFQSVDPITVTDSAQGFFSFWLKPAVDESGMAFLHNDQFIVNSSGGGIHIELADEEYNSYLYLDSMGDPVITNAAWNHILIAWDTNFNPGSRRVALYVNDDQVMLDPGDDEGVAFTVGISFEQLFALSYISARTEGDVADAGMWVGSSIVEADSTILEVNRRKFIDASGKPVDPTNWPASPVLKFSGNAAAFATNQGSGGAFALTGGSLTDAGTSPSD
jgi:hypothetical protein